jgi:branched-chain amino acid transport system ATP-binding protein
LAGDVVIEAEGLTKSFAGFVAVNDVHLQVRRGTIHALIGPNGAGKTTCFNLITKFLDPSQGRIRFKGQDITTWRPAVVARAGMVRSFQISATFPHLTVLENVRIAVQNRVGLGWQFWRSEKVLEALDERVLALLESVGMREMAGLRAAALPYGNKRVLELATTLAMEPEVMLLDEPTAGMGREDIARVSQLIRGFAKGHTILMVEHNLSVVSDLSDVITVLQRGQVLAEGPYEEVSSDPRVVEAYLGTGHG